MPALRELVGDQSADSVVCQKEIPTAALDEATRRRIVADANAHSALGRHGEALACISRGLEIAPFDQELLYGRAAALAASGRHHEAYLTAMRAAAIEPPPPVRYLELGRISFRVGDLQTAEAWLRKAIGLAIAPPVVETVLAAVMHAQGSLEDAGAMYMRAQEVDPKNFDCCVGLGNCLLDQGELGAAEVQFRRAIAIDGGRSVAWSFLAIALDRQDREDESIAAHERARVLEKGANEDGDAALHLAGSLRDMGHIEASLAAFEGYLAGHPQVKAYLPYAHTLLTAGRLPEGWRFNEFRWMTDHFLTTRPNFGRPVWTGQDLRGRCILLCVEQGLGDSIQFVRYAKHVKALGATVLLLVQSALRSLLQGVEGVDRIVELGTTVSIPDFDYYVHLMSLPKVFGTEVASMPVDVPYLRVEAQLAQQWNRRLGTFNGLSVGLVWAGNPRHPGDRYRSIALGTLMPLAAIPGVRYLSLQKGAGEAELSTMTGWAITPLGPELHDLCDAAAVICNLDLVITVDTAIAHLAGALGKPTWLMIALPCDWRWLDNRDDSPWYPSLRLFRQTRRDDWGDVVLRVSAALEEWVGADRSLPPPPIAAPKCHTVRVTTFEKQAKSGIPGLGAMAETRHGIMQYLPDETDVGIGLGWYGEWLEAQVQLIAPRIAAGETVVEFGAGVGAHAIPVGRRVGNGGHLLVSEPKDIPRQILLQNLAANRIQPVTVLGEFGSVDDLHLERLGWVKVDTPEFADRVLAGAGESMWCLRPKFMLAVADVAHGAQVADELKRFGYRCWYHVSNMFNDANFNRRLGDRYDGRSAVAVLAYPEESGLHDVPRICVEFN